MRLMVLAVLMAVALPALALKSGCPAEYNLQQCEQAKEEGGGDDSEGGGSDTCPFYMCGNATPRVQSAWDWCEATQKEEDCPIQYCEYQPCAGMNCTPYWIVCSACSSRQGNNTNTTECPRK